MKWNLGESLWWVWVSDKRTLQDPFWLPQNLEMKWSQLIIIHILKSITSTAMDTYFAKVIALWHKASVLTMAMSRPRGLEYRCWQILFIFRSNGNQNQEISHRKERVDGKEQNYLLSKKSPKSSIRTAAGNVSYRWKAAKYLRMSSSSFTYLPQTKQRANEFECERWMDDGIYICSEWYNTIHGLCYGREILHLYTVEYMRRGVNTLKFRKTTRNEVLRNGC